MSTHLDIHSTINDFVQEDVRRTALLEELGVRGQRPNRQTMGP